MGELLGAMAAGFTPGRVPVLLGHLFTDGALVTPGGGARGSRSASPTRCRRAGCRRRLHVALARPHAAGREGSPGAGPVRGSLLQLDFGEAGQRKSVGLVEAAPGTPAKVREVPLSSGRSLADVRGTLDEVVARGRELGAAHLRVFVATDGPVPGIADRVREELPNALDVHLVYDRVDHQPNGDPVSSLHPREQFVAYFRQQHGAEPPRPILGAFDEVLPTNRGRLSAPIWLSRRPTAFRDEQAIDPRPDLFAIRSDGLGKTSTWTPPYALRHHRCVGKYAGRS
jgi:exonuclease SbcD